MARSKPRSLRESGIGAGVVVETDRTKGQISGQRDHGAVPTWLIEHGYRFGIFAVDCGEPAHVHVRGHGGDGKVWLASLEVAHMRRYNRRQQAVIREIIVANRADFQERWDAFCG